VNTICVAYPGLKKFFPEDKLVVTGNPVRNFAKPSIGSREEGFKFFGLSPELPVIFVTGGSLGAGTINNSLLNNLNDLLKEPIQLLWQTGKYYFEKVKVKIDEIKPSNIKAFAFIDRMDLAYSVSDIVVSRAGAITISELAILEKPAILVPSPNVAEDHQTHNARFLTDKGAAILVKDNEANDHLVATMLKLSKDKDEQAKLSANISNFSHPMAARHIVDEAIKLIEQND
jgi:UDP-N-acetylglucosamine--N-acetylmuramyl-(pentapeptide) pyrophosphoryl-undecaprenol N-acetylglucosamine transferase